MKIDTFRLIPPIVVFLLGIALRFWQMDRPWDTTHDGWCGGFYSISAQNFIRFGYLHSRFGMNTDAGEAADPKAPTLYANHPPTLSLLLSLVHRVTGPEEWATRLFAGLFGSGCLILVWAIGFRLYGRGAALWAALLYAVMPMQTFFGAFANVHGPIDLFFILGAVYAYIRFIQTGRSSRFLLFLLSFSMACLTEWVGFFMIPLFLLLMMVDRTIRDWRRLAILWGLGIALFILLSGYLGWLRGDPFHVLARIVYRASIPEGERLALEEPFGFFDWLMRIVRWNLDWHLAPTLCLTVLFALGYHRDGETSRDRHGRADNWILFLLGIGILFLVVGFQGAYHHRFWSHYLSPGLALASGAILAKWMGKESNREFGVSLLYFPAIALLCPLTLFLPGSDFTEALMPVASGIVAFLMLCVVRLVFSAWEAIPERIGRLGVTFAVFCLVYTGGVCTFFAKIPDPYVREMGLTLGRVTYPEDLILSATEVGHQVRFYARRELHFTSRDSVPRSRIELERILADQRGQFVRMLFIRSTLDGTLDGMTEYMAGRRPSYFGEMFAIYDLSESGLR